MRTTISINDALLERAKLRARELGLTLGAYVEGALQREISIPAKAAAPVSLTVSAATGGPAPGVDLSSNRGLYEAVGASE